MMEETEDRQKRLKQDEQLYGMNPWIVMLCSALAFPITAWQFGAHIVQNAKSPNIMTALQDPAMFIMIAVMLIGPPLHRRFKLAESTVKHVAAQFFILCTAAGIGVTTVMFLINTLFQRQLELLFSSGVGQKLVPFIVQTPDWIIPKSEPALVDLITGGSVHWGVWGWPIVTWSVIGWMFFVFVMCLSILLRRAWMEEEHLIYPVIQPVIALVQGNEENQDAEQSYWVSKRLLLVGCLVGGIGGVTGFLNMIWPVFPQINFFGSLESALRVTQYVSRQGAAGNAIAITASLPVYFAMVNPAVLGLVYLAHSNLLLSASFFIVLRWIYVGLWGMSGHPISNVSGAPEGTLTMYTLENIGYGVYIVLLLLYLYRSRTHIAHVVRIAFRGDQRRREEFSRDSGLSPRWTLFGVFGMPILLVVFYWFAFKASPLWLVVWLLIFSSGVVVTARMRSEMGLPQWSMPFFHTISKSVIGPLGGRNVGLNTASGLGYIENWGYTGIGGVFPFLHETYKLGNSTGLRRRSIFRGVLLVLCSAWTIALIQTIMLSYRFGAQMIGPSVHGNARKINFELLAGIIDGTVSRSLFNNAHFVAGAVLAGVLNFLYVNIAFWPIHPVGLAFAFFHWTLEPFGFDIMLALVIKTLVLRWGGNRLYRTSTSLAIGLILGSVIGGFPRAIYALIQFYLL